MEFQEIEIKSAVEAENILRKFKVKVRNCPFCFIVKRDLNKLIKTCESSIAKLGNAEVRAKQMKRKVEDCYIAEVNTNLKNLNSYFLMAYILL